LADLDSSLRALGLETLGEEVLASLSAAIGEYTMGHRLVLDSEIIDYQNNPTIHSAMYGGIEPLSRNTSAGLFVIAIPSTNLLKFAFYRQILAGTALQIQKEIMSRQRWWNALRRDMKKQMLAQPLFFWGAVFVAFFGMTAVIQTIMSIWAVALALEQVKLAREALQ
jgi:hypothetical protein